MAIGDKDKNMDLLILAERNLINQNNRYRGIQRDPPFDVDYLEEKHPVNQAFRWYAEEDYVNGCTHNLEKASELILEYRSLDPPQYFELVEAIANVKPVEVENKTFLGFDISAWYHFSLLSTDLVYRDHINFPPPECDIYWTIRPLIKLTFNYFRPHLNSNGLFDDLEVANDFLTCTMALQKIRPNLWENEEFVFNVVGLSVICIG